MIRNRHYETGRTMVEMLSILAIIGILAIVVLMAYSYGIHKEQANKIIHDARMIHTNLINHTETTDDWVAVSEIFEPESDKEFFYLFDKQEHLYIKVDEVEEKTCARLIEFEGDKIHFLTTDNEVFTTCEETNALVMDFDDNGLMTECLKADDCEEEGSYCSDGQCGQCADGREINEEGTGCLCLEDEELTCTDEQNNLWCCGKNADNQDTICGTKQGECLPSNGMCSYSFYANGAPGSTFKTDCSYNVSGSGSDNVENYSGDCSYTVSSTDSTAQTWTDGSGTSRNIFGTSVSGNRCSANQYCSLFWKDTDGADDGQWGKDKTTAFSAGDTGVIWGKCQMLSSYDQTPKTQYTVGYGLVNQNTGCDENQYCSLFWTKETWGQDDSTPTIPAGYTGAIYGKCQMLSSYDQTPTPQTETGESASYSANQGCPASQYCYLNWSSDQSCSVAGAGISGDVYGVCSGLSSKGSCPYDK